MINPFIIVIHGPNRSAKFEAARRLAAGYAVTRMHKEVMLVDGFLESGRARFWHLDQDNPYVADEDPGTIVNTVDDVTGLKQTAVVVWCTDDMTKLPKWVLEGHTQRLESWTPYVGMPEQRLR